MTTDEQIRKSLDDWADGVLTDRELIGKVQRAVNWQAPEGWIKISGGTGPVESGQKERNPTEQVDAVKEARALAEKFDSAFNIGADPRDVYLDDLVHDWHKAQSLLKTLADEVVRLCEQWNTRFNTLCGLCGKRYLGPRDEHLHGYGACDKE